MDLFLEEKSICTHMGDDYDRFNGAVVPPIYENSLFIYPKLKDLASAQAKEREEYVYTRGTNPTVQILEKKLAALEHGEACKIFSSGMAAISSAMTAFLKQGDHILFVNSIYGPALQYAKYIEKFGIEHSITSSVDIEEINRMTKSNTKIIYVESPGTMTFKLMDLKAVADFAKSRNILTMIDNTWATPIFQKPLDFGIDISIHSCTKYIGGHSDVVSGAVIASDELIDIIFKNEFMLHGGCIGPFEAWLLMRGLRTLPLRMEKHQESTFRVVEFLENHEKVRKVNFCGLKSSPDYELGEKQLKGYSGLLSFELTSESYEDVERVVDSCRVFKIGVSWGGFESLIISPNYGHNLEDLKKKDIYPGLIRISVGLEGAETLIKDLEYALSQIAPKTGGHDL